ncbi:S41 family peptidase [Bombilactobacillus folatiphilus]|uniref:S41 family peptidase n=1 Tax=Bombilactobacillus folatiphilus TaxID=2923362 RepID=A0ABY4PAT5_9LACO|nr:S41 family peptidase [Bombilactobacillus folatiphilus]UQS82787.1 S41 family peptidase [Bombilactobacillus folatiphilus]
MKKKFSWITLFCSLLGGILLGVIGTFVVLICTINRSTSSSNNFAQVQQVYNTISQSYYKKVSSKKLVNGAIKGMVDSLDDPYSEFMADQEQDSFNSNISGKISGIGATIEQGTQGIQIVAPTAKSPAAKAGLKPKDLIVKINQRSTKKMTVDQASSLTRGKAGTKVHLQIRRGNQTFNKVITRAPIKVATVMSNLDKNDKQIGEITITQFSEHTAKELKQQIQKLKRKGAKKLIIDVRNNPGGVMDQAIAASSMFMSNGRKIMTMDSRIDGKKSYYANKKYLNDYKFKLPTVVLVDKGTASAAEIFAAALKQSAGVKIIGEKTFGKGVVQTLSPLSSNSEMKITTAKWLTPNGSWINHKGLTPSIKVLYPDYLNIKNFTSQKIIKVNEKSSDVKVAQQILVALGQTVPVNGTLDEQTVQQLTTFQSQQQLPTTGQLDLATRQSLTKVLMDKAQKDDPMQRQALQSLKEQ